MNIEKNVLAVALLLLCSTIASCSQKETSDKQSSKDADSRYFASTVYTLPENEVCENIYIQNGDIVIIARVPESDNEAVTAKYNRYTVNDEGELSSPTELEINSPGSFCGVGKDKTAHYSELYGYTILDKNGKTLREEQTESLPSDLRHDIESAADGFVVVCAEEAVLYDESGDIKGKISFDDVGYISEWCAYFESDGQGYLSTEKKPGTTSFWKLDFGKGTYYEAGENRDYGYNDDFAVYRYGGYAYDEDGGVIGRLDLNERKSIPIAYLDNCICPPPSERTTYNIYTYILDNDTFARIYRYDTGKTEIVIMREDASSDYAQRTRLYVKGSAIRQDDSILMAAYLYNTSQDRFYISVDDFGDKYSFSNAVEAQTAKANMIADFQSGGAPDMLYGSDFDYEQMGRSGLVMDILPYLSQDSIGELTGNIKDLMIRDGHCYSVFSGYTLYGFVGRQSQYPDNDYGLNELPALKSGQERISKLYAHDIADHMIRYPIMNPYKRNGVLDNDNLRTIVQTAVDLGVSPSESLPPEEGFESEDISLSLRYINNDIREYISENDLIKDKINFIGFPSMNGSVRAIMPFGQTAVSSGTKYPDACSEFVRILLSPEIQKMNYNCGTIPVNEKTLDEYLGYMTDPDSIPETENVYKEMATMMQVHINDEGFMVKEKCNISIDTQYAQEYKKMLTDVNTLITLDWGIYNIICEEIDSNYSNGKSVDEIVRTLGTRLKLYVEENYQ